MNYDAWIHELKIQNVCFASSEMINTPHVVPWLYGVNFTYKIFGM